MGGNGKLVILHGTSYVNILGALYRKLPTGLKDTRFGENVTAVSKNGGTPLHRDFVGTPIY